MVIVEWFDTGEEAINLKFISVRYAEPSEIKRMMDEEVKPKNQLQVDPDNPPLTGKERFVPAGPHIKAKLAAHKARYAAKKAEVNQTKIR